MTTTPLPEETIHEHSGDGFETQGQSDGLELSCATSEERPWRSWVLAFSPPQAWPRSRSI